MKNVILMMDNSFDIFQLTGEELYTKALKYKSDEDYDNYAIYLVLSADRGNEKAQLFVSVDKVLKKQNVLVTMLRYEEFLIRLSHESNIYCTISLAWAHLSLKNFEIAIELYKVAMEKGSSIATNWLGIMYSDGKGVLKDRRKAVELFEISANHGSTFAIVNLGTMYWIGSHDVPQDITKAVELFEIAIEKGCSDAMNNLAVMYTYGNRMLKNYIKAKELYEMALVTCQASDIHMHRRASIIENFVGMYIASKHLWKKDDIIQSLAKFDELDKLKEIYNFDDYCIKCIKENYAIKKELDTVKKELDSVKKENYELKSHIMASPDGELYFEAKNHWHNNLYSG